MKTHAPQAESPTHQARAQAPRQPARNDLRTEAEDTSREEFVDNRPEASALRRYQAMADRSPQVQRLVQLQAMIDHSPQVQALARRQAMIDHSPYMVAQRQRLRRLFGNAAQFKGGLEEEELLQGKFESIQRKDPSEEDELLQGKFAVMQRRGLEDDELQMKKAPTALAQFQPEPLSPKNDTGLPDNLKSGIESLSGISMDHVNVHYNSSKPAHLSALAYTQGSDIYVAPGQEQHLPHEAWHVVQQAQGRVKPTRQMEAGVPVNENERLEKEAEVMGTRAVTHHATNPSEGGSGSPSSHHTHRARQGDLGTRLHGAGARQAVQRYRILGKPKYKSDGNRAGTSELTIKMDGQIGRPSANAPKAKLKGRQSIRDEYKMKSENEPFAMHLVNGRLGGSGTDRENLAWGTHNFNAKHVREWEIYRQDEAKANPTGIMQMAVTAHYKSDSRYQRADYFFLEKLTCKHRICDNNWNEIDTWKTVEITDGQSYEEADSDYEESGQEESESDM